jgi:NADH-dependent peroxiredoxin subunit C
MIGIGDRVPSTVLDAFHEGEVRPFSFAQHRGRWVAVVFYPGDFTFICPTELREAARLQGAFGAAGCDVVAVSTDSVWVHKAWHDASAAISEVRYPLVADPAATFSREFGVYIEAEGVARRGSFVVDPDGVVQTLEIHDNSVGRSMTELLRRVEAAKYVREHDGEVCPVAWQPGEATLVPGLQLVGAI